MASERIEGGGECDSAASCIRDIKRDSGNSKGGNVKGIRKIRQAWILCQTRRQKKNYKQRIAYRAKVIRDRAFEEVVNEDKNQD